VYDSERTAAATKLAATAIGAATTTAAYKINNSILNYRINTI